MAELNNHLNPEIVESLKIKFEETEGKNSIKTNWLITNRNFKKLKIFLDNLVAYVLELSTKIKPEEITNEVIDTISNDKPRIDLTVSMQNNQQINQGDYVVQKFNDDIYKITRRKDSANWNTDLLIVSASETETGIRLYPVITGKGPELQIYFVDGMHTNVTIFWL